VRSPYPGVVSNSWVWCQNSGNNFLRAREKGAFQAVNLSFVRSMCILKRAHVFVRENSLCKNMDKIFDSVDFTHPCQNQGCLSGHKCWWVGKITAAKSKINPIISSSTVPSVLSRRAQEDQIDSRRLRRSKEKVCGGGGFIWWFFSRWVGKKVALQCLPKSETTFYHFSRYELSKNYLAQKHRHTYRALYGFFILGESALQVDISKPIYWRLGVLMCWWVDFRLLRVRFV